MLFVLLAFFAGIITVFAPCVFALLPVIIGGSISGDVNDKRRPFIVVASAAASLLIFTLLLKVTTLFIDVPPAVITGIAGSIIVLLGMALLFPSVYEKIIVALNLQAKSQQLLGKGSSKGPIGGAIITGAALGPVFSSCSPVYAYILATVLPVNFNVAMVYMVSYVAGLSLMLLLVGFLGQKLVRKLKWASNPRGLFTRIIAIMFILVGILIISGFDKKFQTFVAEYTPFDFDSLSAELIPANKPMKSSIDFDDSGVFNVSAYKAPEITGIQDWINSEPLKISELKGKVVLIDFWTYSCINCIRTQPYLKQWYETYHNKGFEIIGVHAPEFAFERVKSNVQQASKDAGLTYPIALDNEFATWRAYQNQYWPATYLIDKDGKVRRTHFGEGEYEQQENAIRQLLAEDTSTLPSSTTTGSELSSASRQQSPEIYLGLERSEFYGGDSQMAGTHDYKISNPPYESTWTIGGKWKTDEESIMTNGDGVLKIRLSAKDVYLVAESHGGSGDIDIFVDGKSVGSIDSAGSNVIGSTVTVSNARLYHIVSFDTFQRDALIELRVKNGVQMNAFTFGS